MAVFLSSGAGSYPVLAQARPGTVKAATPAISRSQIEEAIHTAFGPRVEVMTGDPFYLTADFNGDGNVDVAVQINIEKAVDDLTTHRVSFIDVDPYSNGNGSKVDPRKTSVHNCVGVAILHGTASGWATSTPDHRFLFYECFSGFKLIPRHQRIRSRSPAGRGTPVLRGDAIQLELETGGRNVVYWDGHTYRGYALRVGD